MNEENSEERDMSIFKLLEKSKFDISEFFNNNENDIDEVLLLDENFENTMNSMLLMAPGQGKKPLPWLIQPNIDEFCFPRIFGGRSFNTNNETYTIRAKSELQRADRRSCEATRVLYLAKRKLEHECFNNVYTNMRKTTRNDGRKFTAKDCLDKDFADNIVKHNAGYRSLKSFRGTPAYWEHVRKVNMAMIRQLGAPTFFITLSPGERIWLELIQILYKYQHGKDLTLDEVAELDDDIITDLIRRDPVMCARYFENEAEIMMKCFQKKGGIFGEYEVGDYYN